MLRGIDISNHQAGIDLPALFPHVDFVICKATEGIGFVDKQCDPFIQGCMTAGKPFGYYHFARENSPYSEAQFFYENTMGYHRKGVPVLDWETSQNVAWVNSFVERFHQLSGIWPWIYGNPWRFNQGGVNKNCGRWIAQYPNVLNPGLDYQLPPMPETDGLVCAWQYASDGRVQGYPGNLDVNVFFGDVAAWNAYCGKSDEMPDESNKSSILENDEYRIEITRK